MEPLLEKDQHFLVDKKILQLEIEKANLNQDDKVLEIGAGSGTLTQEIVKKTNNVLAFEIDGTFEKELKKIKGAKIIIGNALEYDWRGYNKIVSNIPYSLSEPVIMKSIWDGIGELTLIVGENFKNILCSQETKIGILANLVYEISPIVKVDKKSFSPVPRVNSWLVKLSSKKGDKITDILKQIIFRNGKIKNSIVYSLIGEGLTKKQAKKAVEEMKIEKLVLEKPTSKMTGKFILILKKKLEELFS